MFGFIRPMRSELKVRELERFQAVYCGLCHCIRKRYGLMQTMLLSYDCTYLALVLDASRPSCENCKKRCIVHPFRRRSCAGESDGIRHAAAVSVILNYHRLGDTAADETGWKRWAAKCLRFVLRRGYRKAKAENELFDQLAQQGLGQLAQLERDRIDSLDIPADAFAGILRAAIPQDREDSRILSEMFYHTGRWIYLIDACDDLEKDFGTGNYNPVRYRYGLARPDLTEVKEQLNRVLMQMLADSYRAFVLLDLKRDSGIIENILCWGLPEVTRQVLNGTFENNGGKNRHGSI